MTTAAAAADDFDYCNGVRRRCSATPVVLGGDCVPAAAADGDEEPEAESMALPASVVDLPADIRARIDNVVNSGLDLETILSEIDELINGWCLV